MVKGLLEYIHLLFTRKIELYNGFSGEQFGLLRKRFYAFVIDLGIITLLSKTIVYSLISSVSQFLDFSQNYQVYNSFDVYMTYFNALVITLVMINYHFLSCLLGRGITPGKFIFNLQVIPLDSTKELKISSCLIRSLSYPFLYWGGFLFYALPLIIKEGIGIQDWLSHSKVIDSSLLYDEEREIDNDQTKLLLLSRSSHL